MREHYDVTCQYSNFRMSMSDYLHCPKAFGLDSTKVTTIFHITHSNRRQLFLEAR